MEFAAGGELFDRIVERGVYSERQAAEVVTRVLEALVYLHSNNIIHRDIKPENLLLAGKDNDVEVKLSDFGVVAILEAVEVERANSVASEAGGGGGLADDSRAGGGGGGGGRSRIPSVSVAAGGRGRAFTAVGSDTYTAPEMLRGDGYDERVDLWSTGVVLYILLCGFPPFQDNQFDWSEGQSRRRLVFPEEHWSDISEAAKVRAAEALPPASPPTLSDSGNLVTLPPHTHYWTHAILTQSNPPNLKGPPHVAAHRRSGGAIQRTDGAHAPIHPRATDVRVGGPAVPDELHGQHAQLQHEAQVQRRSRLRLGNAGLGARALLAGARSGPPTKAVGALVGRWPAQPAADLQ